MKNEQWFLIKNEEEYNRAMARYQEVRKAERGTDEHELKMLLVHLMEEFEKNNFIPEELDPVDLILIRLEDKQLKQKDLGKEFGGDTTMISKVLNRKISLSINMIRTLSRVLDLPVSALIKEYPLAASEHKKEMV